jgi:Leucine-rich repeat (LRR) protein
MSCNSHSLLILTKERLDLSNNDGLTGKLSPDFFTFPMLNELFLGGNLITGSIPTQIGMTTTLEVLVINNSYLNGTLPTQLGQLTALQRLDFGTNAPLVGPIPTELGLLRFLEVLVLSNNRLTGSIPTELGMIETLKEVQLGGNALMGAVPAEVCSVASDGPLSVLVVDCGGAAPNVTCAVPDCCSNCTGGR